MVGDKVGVGWSFGDWFSRVRLLQKPNQHVSLEKTTVLVLFPCSSALLLHHAEGCGGSSSRDKGETGSRNSIWGAGGEKTAAEVDVASDGFVDEGQVVAEKGCQLR